MTVRGLCFCVVAVSSAMVVEAEIIVTGISSDGDAIAVSGQDSDSWRTTALGTFSANASADDPNTPGTNIHTASASSTLSYNGSGFFEISGSANVNATSQLTGFTATSAFAGAMIDFSTDTSYIFTFNDPQALATLTGSTFAGSLTRASPIELGPGTYQFSGFAAAQTQSGSAAENFTASVSLVAVPEPSSFAIAGLVALLAVTCGHRTAKGDGTVRGVRMPHT